MTGRPRVVRVLPDPEALARAAAEEVAGRLAAAARARGLATIALSGGSTPRVLHALMTAEDGPFRARMPWPATQFFWGDERHVPPDHPDSNYRMARETLLSRVPVAAAQVHRIPAEMPDAELAEAAEAPARLVPVLRGARDLNEARELARQVLEPEPVQLPDEARPTLERFKELRGGASNGLDHDAARELVRELKAVGGDLKTLRLALTGRDRGPELAALLEVLPKDEALRRADAAL